MLKTKPVDWLLARIARSRPVRRRSLNWQQGCSASHVPAIVQPLENRLLLAAEIVVLGNAVEIQSGDLIPTALDGTVFSNVIVSGDFSSQTYTIQNTGDSELNISGITTGGLHANNFTISNAPTTVAPNGGTATFDVDFVPTATGLRTATISIGNNDLTGFESPFVFAVLGLGIGNTAPLITSIANVSIGENLAAVTTVTAADVDVTNGDQLLEFSLVGGADVSLFSIDASTGVLSFNAAADFENPGDDGGNNIYDVVVQVSDGVDSVTQALAVTVTDVVNSTGIVSLESGGGSYTVRVNNGNLQIQQLLPTTNTILDQTLSDVGNLVINGSVDADLVTLDASLSAFSGTVTLNAGDGNDVFDGSATAIVANVLGGDGNDTIIGGGGADTLLGGNGADSITGGAAGDLLSGNGGDDTMSGDDGDDILNGHGGGDLLNGGDDNDTLLGGAGRDTLDGGLGNDLVSGQGGSVDIVAGGTGVDILLGDSSDVTIAGSLSEDPTSDDPDTSLSVNLPSSGGPFTVQVTGGEIQVVSPGGTIASGLLSDINEISIDGSSNDDNITIAASLLSYTGTLIINGGDGNDVLDGTAVSFATTLLGGAGNDTLLGGSSNDSFNGGDGDDSVDGGNGNDTLMGGGGNDILLGGTGNDMLNGNAGDDSLFGGANGDTILGGAGTDLLDGDAGDDMVNGQGGLEDTVAGGAGDNDTLRGDASDILIEGPSGSSPSQDETANPTLTANLPDNAGTVTVNVVGGQIVVTSSLGTLVSGLLSGTSEIVINGGDDNDVVAFGASMSTFAGLVTFNGGAGNDSLDTSLIPASVHFNGGIGDDTVVTGSGDDSIEGSSGDDSISTGDGRDTVHAGDGNDFIDVGRDDDSVRGGGGDDSIIGGGGNDFLNGNSGSDTISGDDGDDTLLGGTGNDSLDGGLGDDRIRGHDGDDDTVIGGGGMDDVSADY